MTKTFPEVISGIRTAKKGVEVREDIAQMGEYVEQFASTATTKASEAEKSAERAKNAVNGIDQQKADAVKAVQQAQATATAAVTETKNAALQEVSDATADAKNAASAAGRYATSANTSASTASGAAATATTKAGEAATSATQADASQKKAAENQQAAEDAANRAAAIVNTDKTLRVNGAPADAKAVGDIVLDPDGNAIFYSKAEMEAKIKEILAAQREEDLAKIKFWASDDPTSPASFIGGTWERIEGKFIMGASDTYPAGSTGGSATHAQTKEELYPHSHRLMQSGKDAKMNTASMGRNGPLTSDVDEYVAFGDSVQLFSSYSFTIETVGGGQPMNILNPYYSAYVWRRVPERRTYENN